MKITAIALCLALLGLLSCRSNDSTGPGSEPLPLLGTNWTLFAVAAGDVSNLLGEDLESPPTILFEQGEGALKVSGFTSVNRFSGSCTLGEAEEMTFSPLITTRMAGPPERMELEAQFVSQLSSTRFYAISGNELSLFTEAGRLGFRAQ